MAKGCAGCSGSRRVTGNSNFVAPAMAVLGRSEMLAQLNNTNLSLVVYVGSDNTLVPSVSQFVSYGIRKYGSKMWVAQEDVDANPTLFSTEEAFNAKKKPKANTRRRKKEDVETVQAEEPTDDSV